MFRPLLISSLLWSCYPVVAQITLDGTLGHAGTLPGPDFQIGADVGQQHGGNLFHSFQDFNLQSHESATFSGPNNVQNIISRVTGGNPSSIDGTLRSTIPNADMYFLNPHGIMFGPHAKLDVQGGFHASTADYLRLQDGGRFEARTPSNSLLTVAPVAAFGFLTDTPATITTQDSTLMVPPLKPLSLIGGHLHLRGSLPVQIDDNNTSIKFATSLLHTTGGHLHLAAVGSAGEVLVADNDFNLIGRGGEIRLDHTLIDTSGPGSGNLKVRGRWLWMQDSTLQTNTLGEFDGGTMDLQLTESLHTKSDQTYFPAFGSQTFGRGHGGSIGIKVPELTLTGTWIGAQGMGGGGTGDIGLEVTRLTLSAGGHITNGLSGGSGRGGQITIKATESVSISGQNIGSRLINHIIPLTEVPAGISNYTYSTEKNSLGGANIDLTTSRLDLVGGLIFSVCHGTGNASNISIHADNVNLTEGAMIHSSAVESGMAGNIRLDVKDTLLLSGRRVGPIVATGSPGVRLENNQTSIHSVNLYGGGGQISLTAKTIHLTKEALITTSSLGLSEKIGSINLQTENLLVEEGAQINSSNGIHIGTGFFMGKAPGGDIRIQAQHLTLVGQPTSLQTGIFSDTYNQGQGGNLFVDSDSLDLTGGAAISARSYNVGDAGRISLHTSHLHLAQHSSISTAATQAGGGNIDLLGLSDLLYLDDGEITTSVTTGEKSGGNITIGEPQFTILNKGLIRAQADAGNGGNIRIVAEQFIASPDSIVSASSRLGIDGEVRISSPDPNLSSKLFLVTTKGLDVTNQLKRPCGSAKSLEEILNPRFKFYVYPIAGSRQSVEDWGPSPLPGRSARVAATGKPGTVPGKPTEAEVDRSGYQQVRLMAECLGEENEK